MNILKPKEMKIISQTPVLFCFFFPSAIISIITKSIISPNIHQAESTLAAVQTKVLNSY